MRLISAVYLAAVITVATSWIAFGQSYTISTFAGGGWPVNAQGTSVPLTPAAAALDKGGNIYFSDGRNIVLRLDATTGIVTLVAGNGTAGFSGDNGPAINAQLNRPQGVAVDAAGAVYIADYYNGRIRKVSNGVITTIAGGGPSQTDNAPAVTAQLSPRAIALDSAGNLYLTDEGTSRIRKLSNGVVTTVAGNGTAGFSGDNGLATSAQLYLGGVEGIALDSAGNLYFADAANQRVRKVSNGVITTVAGNGTQGSSGDNGPATSAQLSVPAGVAVDNTGSLYIAEFSGFRIRKVSNGVISTFAGSGTFGFSSGNIGDNGPATAAQLFSPTGLALDPAGNLYIADAGLVRKVSNGVITSVAGGGTFVGDTGQALNALFSVPVGVTVDSAGNVFVADEENALIRKISSGIVTSVPVSLSLPEGVATDASGNLYIADSGNSQILEVSNGVTSTAVGNGLNRPVGIAVDAAGNLYIADTGHNQIRKVSNGVTTTIAGSGTAGFGGDNGLATNAQLNNPTGVAVDSAGNLYIADYANHRVRKVSNGVITTLAGNGTAGFGGDNGPASDAQLNNPQAVAVDSARNVFVADRLNFRVRKVSNGVISTVAGNGTPGFSGDGGSATGASLNGPVGIAVDFAGNVYVSDYANNRIRLLTPSTLLCNYAATPTSLTFPAAGGNSTVSIQTTTGCAWSISGLPNWLTAPTSSGSGPATITLTAAPNSGAAQTATITVAGQPITITQAAGTSACNYTLSAGGQAFAATGGTGTFAIATGVGCSWTAGSTANWITVSGIATGTGTGTVAFQAAANTGAARSGTVTIAGLSFTIEEGAATITGLSNAGSMAQLASAGSWTTTITLINTGSVPAVARLNFFGDNGSPVTLPWTSPQTPTASGPELASTLDRTLNPGAELVLQTTGPASQTVTTGWAQLQSNGGISGYAVFSAAIGSAVQDAVAQLETRSATGYVVSFDNTNGNAAGMAVANLTAQSLPVSVAVRDATGAVLLRDTITLPATGHTSFVLATRYGNVVAGQLGTVEFRTQGPGQVSVLGIRGNATGAFSNIPAAAE